MSFTRTDELGNPYRYAKAVCDCTGDEPITEQNHKDSADINKIIAKHGMDMIAKTALLKQAEYQYDDLPGNDFQEAMEIVTKAQQNFETMPAHIRKEFNNSPAQFLDFVQNPDNNARMIELNLMPAPVQPEPVTPVEVVVVTPSSETPPV